MPRITLASDSFNRADENPLGNSVWTGGYTGHNSLQIVSNQVRGTTLTTVHLASYTGITWPNDHWSQATLITYTSAVSGPNLCVRLAAAATNTKYWIDTNGSDQYVIKKTVAGVNTLLASSSTVAANNDVVRLEAQGTTITVYVNGTSIVSAVDGAIASGKAGLGLYVDLSLANTIFDTWSGGTFASRLLDGGSLIAGGILQKGLLQ